MNYSVSTIEELYFELLSVGSMNLCQKLNIKRLTVLYIYIVVGFIVNFNNQSMIK